MSRFHPDSRKASVFQGEWFKPEIFAAVRLLNRLANDAGIAPVEASLRWIAHVSYHFRTCRRVPSDGLPCTSTPL